ncbi:hemerythrin domain-containing protein [Actinophytocola sp.]|uniref:hemerythrin domain-containing protein n=1 Tax=Actinophytocola sp. TaxID=1872138 RepID=UPI002ED51588
MNGRLDMTSMYAMHDALRRELVQLARVTTRVDGDPYRVLHTAAGWALFTTCLRVHHSAEDDTLWPALRRTLADRPDELALLEAIEAEHAAIADVVAMIEDLLTTPETGLDRLGDLTDSLATGLAGHLKHEEDQALPLVQAFTTPAQWAHFGEVHAQRIAPDIARVLPWLLDGATEQTAATVLAVLPASGRTEYTTRWRPAFAALDRWSPNTA